MFDLKPKTPYFNFIYYKKRINQLLKNLPINLKLQNKIKSFIETNKNLFKEIAPALSHGDFSEANILFYKNQIKVLDWEHVHFHNPLYDFASFFIKRKNHKKEQQILLKTFLKEKPLLEKSVFQNLFTLALIELALGELTFFSQAKKATKANQIDRLKDLSQQSQESLAFLTFLFK